MLDDRVRARSPVPREVDPGCGFMGAAQPSRAPADTHKQHLPEALLTFQGLGRGGEQQVSFLEWCPACFSARECLHPIVLVLWHPSSSPETQTVGFGKQARDGWGGGGFMGTCQTGDVLDSSPLLVREHLWPHPAPSLFSSPLTLEKHKNMLPFFFFFSFTNDDKCCFV